MMLKIVNYTFLFCSVFFSILLLWLGIFNYLSIVLLTLYVNSIILITVKDINYIVRNTMILISTVIFFYMIYLIYIHMGLGQINSQFSA